MLLLAASILYTIATILGLWSASLIWRAWHSWRLQRRARRKDGPQTRSITPARRRLGIGLAVIALPPAGAAFSFGETVRSGFPDDDDLLLRSIARAAVAVLIFMAVGAAYVALRFDPSHGRRRCRRCWYDMSATPGPKCPECGHNAPDERALFRTRRAPGLLAFALLLLALAYGAHLAPRINRNGWNAAVPTTAMIAALPWLPDHMVYGPGETLSRRLRYGEIWTWQNSLLTWRCARIIRRSGDVDAVARASMLIQERGWDDSWSMSRAGQHAFFRRLADSANAGRLSRAIEFAVPHLPPSAHEDVTELAFASVVAALGSGDEMVRHYGVLVASSLGPRGEELVPLLEAMVDDETIAPQSRITAVQTLARMGLASDAAWRAYLRAFDSTNTAIREWAVHTACRTSRFDESLEQRLREALLDPWDNTRIGAAKALLRFPRPVCDWIPRLAPLLNQRPRAAQEIIGDLAGACPSAEVIDAVQWFIRSGEPDTVLVGVRAAHRLGVHAETLLPDLRALRGVPALLHLENEIEDAIWAIEAAVKNAARSSPPSHPKQ